MRWLPKLDEGMNASWLMMFDKMLKGKFEGFFAWGQNPACSGANSNKTRQALAKLKWMVNVNLFDNETGSFWKGPGMNPKDIQTEVFLLPAHPPWKRKAAFRTPDGGRSGATRPSIRSASPSPTRRS